MKFGRASSRARSARRSARLRIALVFLWLGAQSFACKQQRETSASTGPTPTAHERTAARSVASAASVQSLPSALAAASSCPESAPSLSEASLKAALSAFRAAQRSADLGAAAGFYAPSFSGLLELPDSMALLDREHWLSHPRGVAGPQRALEGPALALGAGGARVRVGAEELFFIPTSAGPKIAWQAPTAPRPTSLSERPGLWLADEDAALLSATPDSSWGDGPPLLAATNRATRSVVMARLPKSLRAWLGRRVKVIGAGGAVCETRLQRFVLRAQITPPHSTAERWEGCGDGPPIVPERIAEEIFRLTSSQGQSLVGEFSAPCKGALLAMDPDLPDPPIAAPEPADAELGAELLRAFRALPRYAEIQARFRAEQPELDGAWDDREGHRILSKLELKGHAPLFFVSVAAGSGCANFSASLSALWLGSTKTTGQIISAIDEARLTPSAIVDLDGNGGSILLGPDGRFAARSVLRVHAGALAQYQRDFLSIIPFFAGPC